MTNDTTKLDQMVLVPLWALTQVLRCIIPGAPAYLIRELRTTRGLPGVQDPIGVLIAAADKAIAEPSNVVQFARPTLLQLLNTIKEDDPTD